MNIKIQQIDYHRNGISGAGFHVVLFTDMDTTATPTRLIDKINHQEGNTGNMIGIVFQEPEHVAVFDREKLGAGIIAFGQNSWRGDRYEGELRAAIEAWNGDTDKWRATGIASALETIAETLNVTTREAAQPHR